MVSITIFVPSYTATYYLSKDHYLESESLASTLYSVMLILSSILLYMTTTYFKTKEPTITNIEDHLQQVGDKSKKETIQRKCAEIARGIMLKNNEREIEKKINILFGMVSQFDTRMEMKTLKLQTVVERYHNGEKGNIDLYLRIQNMLFKIAHMATVLDRRKPKIPDQMNMRTRMLMKNQRMNMTRLRGRNNEQLLKINFFNTSATHYVSKHNKKNRTFHIIIQEGQMINKYELTGVNATTNSLRFTYRRDFELGLKLGNEEDIKNLMTINGKIKLLKDLDTGKDLHYIREYGLEEVTRVILMVLPTVIIGYIFKKIYTLGME